MGVDLGVVWSFGQVQEQPTTGHATVGCGPGRRAYVDVAVVWGEQGREPSVKVAQVFGKELTREGATRRK